MVQRRSFFHSFPLFMYVSIHPCRAALLSTGWVLGSIRDQGRGSPSSLPPTHQGEGFPGKRDTESGCQDLNCWFLTHLAHLFTAGSMHTWRGGECIGLNTQQGR